MGILISDVKEHLIAVLHSGSIAKVRNFAGACERAASTMLLKVKPVETQRTVPLSTTVHDALYNYALPSDFNSPIDLYPQADRSLLDKSRRVYAEAFDIRKALNNKSISIEGSEGSKFLRINWKWRSPKILSTMDSYNGNGTWTAVGSATSVTTDTITKYSGGGSVRFNVVASGDGIQNTTLTAVDLTNEDQVADVLLAVYFGSVSSLTSIQPIWGNDLTTNYWTGVAQTTQADGTAFKVGWNIIKVPWSSATQSGTVAPATIDSFKLVFASTGAIANVRVDNILFSIGRAFDLKYYSKFFFKNSSGTFITKPTAADDSDVALCDNDSLQIFVMELMKALAHQVEGEDSDFDIDYANRELADLYPAYMAEHPSESKKQVTSYGGLPRFKC